MKKFIQILILAWFIIAGGLVLFTGILLITDSRKSVAEVPAPPPPPPWKELKTADDAAKVYAAQTSAYEKQLAAISARASAERSPDLETYKTVAKDTLQPLLNSILGALLAYVFVKGAATLVNNQMLLRANAPPQPLDLP